MTLTEAEAEALITRLAGSSRPIRMHPFEYGWAATLTPSPEEIAQGRHIGQGMYIIDRTGIVTVQRSLPVPLIIRQYTEARRQGRILGWQIWPEAETTTNP